MPNKSNSNKMYTFANVKSFKVNGLRFYTDSVPTEGVKSLFLTVHSYKKQITIESKDWEIKSSQKAGREEEKFVTSKGRVLFQVKSRNQLTALQDLKKADSSLEVTRTQNLSLEVKIEFNEDEKIVTEVKDYINVGAPTFKTVYTGNTSVDLEDSIEDEEVENTTLTNPIYENFFSSGRGVYGVKDFFSREVALLEGEPISAKRFKAAKENLQNAVGASIYVKEVLNSSDEASILNSFKANFLK